ncbi:hypothetical protein AHF37_12298 [Paragonimus kellicotti]|nr:hypothetical protein AHF37_12298 [Paragonimus kellicotti]
MPLPCTLLLPLLFLGFIPRFSLRYGEVFINILNSANITNVTYFNLTDCLAFFALKVEVVNTKSQGAITLPPTHELDATRSKCGTGSSVMAVSYSNVQDIRRLDLSIEFSLNYQHWVVNTANITTECMTNSTVCIGVTNGNLDLDWLTAVDGMSFKCTSPPLVTLVSSTVNPPPLALRFTWLQVCIHCLFAFTPVYQ